MTSKAVEGLNRLRNAAIFWTFGVFYAPTWIALLMPAANGLGGAATFWTFGVIFLMAVTGLLLILAAWVFKALGWWSMRESGWRTKKFYTTVSLTVILGPLVAVPLIVAGIVLGCPQCIAPILYRYLGPGDPRAGSALMFAGFLVMAIVSFIEGATSLDVGLRTNVTSLSAGSVAYLVAALTLLFASGCLGLIVAFVANLVANILLAIGFNRAGGVVMASEAQ